MPGDEDEVSAIDGQNTEVQETIEQVADRVTDLASDAPEWARALMTRVDGIASTTGSIASLQTRQAEREQAIEEAARQRAAEEARAKANEQAVQSQTSEQVAEIAEALTPEGEADPKAGEHPANIQELPEKESDADRGKSWWFGKSARRHEDSKKRFGL